MNTTWKTVRVFISSTFRDMQAERDHLVRFVFPRLREELLKRRIHFSDVDLRWGVTSEQDASEVCCEIIDECRPRFLCMLGGRYGWVPPGKKRSITADEVHYGVLDQRLKDRRFAYFYFRDDTATAAMVETTPGELREPQGSDNQNRLAELKQAIIAAGLDPFTYPAQWDNESRRLTGLKKFGDRVYDDLLDSMKSDPELQDRFVTDTASQLDEFDEENAAMEAFVEERSERFVLGSREAVLEELLAHASATGGNGYVCLIGAPGSGKSALLAHLSRHSTLNSQPLTLLIRHFVGASPGSTDVRRTLRRLCHELKVGCSDITADIPDDPEKLRVAFLDFLRQANAKKCVVILLDAVNQFNPSSHSTGLRWLPEELPKGSRVILSAHDGPALEELRRRHHKPREIELEPLTVGDSEAIIEQFLIRYRKKFEPDQRAALLAKTDADTPLYLLAAMEELRTLGTYEEISHRIAELPLTTHELFAWILERLESDDGFRDTAGRRIGRELVSRFAALLGASRYGLSQRELADLLDVGDPQGNVAALLHLLRPYLMRRGELLDFYHGQFRAAAEQAWLNTDAQRQAVHAVLACYFRGQADPEEDQSWKGEGRRSFLELPFHLARSNAEQLAQLLFDFNWLQAKTDKTLVYQLIQDYEEARRALPENHPNRVALGLLQGTIRRSMHVISSDKNQLAGQLVGRLLGFKESEVKRVVDAAGAWRGASWLRPLRECLAAPGSPLLHTLRGHNGPVSAVAFTPDGLCIISADRYEDVLLDEISRTLPGYSVVNSDGRPVVPTSSKLRIWDFQSGDLIREVDSESHSAISFCITPDGKRLVSSAAAALGISVSNATAALGALIVWDSEMWTPIRRLNLPHRYRVTLATLPDNKRFVSASDSGFLLWDLDTGEQIRRFEEQPGRFGLSGDGTKILLCGHHGKVSFYDVEKDQELWSWPYHQCPACVAVTPDGRRAICGFCGGWPFPKVEIWDLEHGTILYRMWEDRWEAVTAVAVSLDGKLGFTASGDGSVTAWSMETGEPKGTFRPANAGATAIAISPDARSAALAIDCDVLVCNLDSWLKLEGGGAPSSEARVVAVTPDGRYALTDSPEHHLRTWDLNTGELLREFRGHTGRINVLTVDSDGKHVISGSDDLTVRIWRLDSGKCRVLAGHKYGISGLSISPDGSKLVSFSSGDGDLRVWSLKSGALWSEGRLSLEFLAGHVQTRSGIPAVMGPWEDMVITYDLRERRPLDRRHKFGEVIAAAVSPDGERVLTSAREHRHCIFWDPRSGDVLSRIPMHQVVTVVALSPDKHTAATACADGTVKLWDLVSGRGVASFHCDAAVVCCAIGGRGEDWHLVTCDALGRLQFLRMEKADH